MVFEGKPIGASPERRPPTPRFLLFDLGNVFLAADHKITHNYLQEHFGISPERAASYFTGAEYRDFTRGLIGEHAFSDALRMRLHAPSLTDQQLRTAHNLHIYGLVPGMEELLAKLTEQYGNSSIVFATDINTWETARQQELIDLSKYQVITSDAIHMLKSDPETIDENGHKRSFFLSVLDDLKVKPEEALLIDDSPEKIAMANHYGLQTIQFMNEPQLQTALSERGIIQK